MSAATTQEPVGGSYLGGMGNMVVGGLGVGGIGSGMSVGTGGVGSGGGVGLGIGGVGNAGGMRMGSAGTGMGMSAIGMGSGGMGGFLGGHAKLPSHGFPFQQPVVMPVKSGKSSSLFAIIKLHHLTS